MFPYICASETLCELLLMKTARLLLLSFVIVALGVCCTQPTNPARKRLDRELKQLQSQMPYTVFPGTSIVFANAFLNEDTAAFVLTASMEDIGTYFLTDSLLNSERNIARILSLLGDSLCGLLESAEVGYELIVLNNGVTQRKLCISPSQLSAILGKMKAGELPPYTMRELAIMEIEAMQFPSQVDEGLWATNAYVDGNNIINEYVDENASWYDLSPEGIEFVKEETIADLRATMLYAQIEAYQKEHLSFVYIYRDQEGNELLRIDIDANEL